MATDLEVRIAHSQSSPNKVWVTLVETNQDEFAVGFDKHDINQILQVNETLYDELEEDELDEASEGIAQCRAALALCWYYPDQFVLEPENEEVIAYLEDVPSKYISTKHIERVGSEHYDLTEWDVYGQIAPRKKPSFFKRKPATKEPEYDDDEELAEEDEVSDDDAQYDSDSE
jgi:hypothetical protein